MCGFNIGGKHESLLNTLNFISKWSIWKTRNKVKYDKIHINQDVLCNIWKHTLKSIQHKIYIKLYSLVGGSGKTKIYVKRTDPLSFEICIFRNRQHMNMVALF